MTRRIVDRVARLKAARPPAFHLGAFYLAYVLAAGVGQGLVIVPGVVMTFWPPSGLFLGTLVMNQPRSWPWFVLAGCLAELSCNALWYHNAMPLAVTYFAGNAAESLTGAYLLRRFASTPFRLDSLRDFALFVGLAAAFAPTVGATVIATVDAFFKTHDIFTNWGLFWLGNATGVLVAAPPTIIAILAWRERNLGFRQYLEGAAALACLVALTLLEFSGVVPTLYLPLAPLLWIAARFQLRGAAGGLAVLTLLVSLLTASGMSPPGPGSLAERMVSVQIFLALSGVCALMVAAISAESQRARVALQHANESLESKVAERTAELRKSESRFREAADVTGALIYQVDLPEGTSGAYGVERFTGADVAGERLTSAWWHKRIHPDDLPDHLDKLARCLGDRDCTEYSAAYRILHSDGSWRHVEDTARIARDAHGNPTRLTGSIFDLTERTLSQEALRESERRLALPMAASATGVWDWDIATGRVNWSGQIHDIFGVDRFEGTRDAFARFVHADDAERLWAAVETALHEGSMSIEFRIVRGDGMERWVSNQATIIRGPDGAPARLLGTVRDITTRRINEDRNQYLMREVDHRAKNMLALVEAVARHTAASGFDNFVQRFSDRLRALASSQNLLVAAGWKEAPLAALVESQLLHFHDLIGSRIVIDGPPLNLAPSAAEALGMALHELATNAAKYGALSVDCGSVRISWCVGEADNRHVFQMIWEEAGGPRVVAPDRTGFGQRVVKEMVERALSAKVTLAYNESGVNWTLTCALASVASSTMISAESDTARSA